MDDDVERQMERLVGLARAQQFVLQTLVAHVLGGDNDPVAGARALRAAMSDRFADAPTGGKMDREKEARINHFSAHFVEEFWTTVEATLARREAMRG